MAPRVPQHPPAPLDDHLCYAIYSAGMAIQRLYKPFLDELGLTYPQYLVLSVLWSHDRQPVGAIASSLALESSTLTPLLKRLEAAGLVRRNRNPQNERQVIVELTERGVGLRDEAGCLGDELLRSSGQTAGELSALNHKVRSLRDHIYEGIDDWEAPI